MEKPLTPPKAIVFDWDNTLVDTWPVIHAALVDTFVAMGHAPWSFEETKDRVSHSLRDAFPVLFGDRWEDARDAYYASFEARHLEALTALSHAEQLLALLQQKRVPMGVVSNKTGRFLQIEIDHMNWRGFFSAALGAGDAEHDKPHPTALETALNSMNVEARGPDVWFVGDSRSDMEIAANTGSTSILIHPDPAMAVAFSDCPPDAHFLGLTGLMEAVQH